MDLTIFLCIVAISLAVVFQKKLKPFIKSLPEKIGEFFTSLRKFLDDVTGNTPKLFILALAGVLVGLCLSVSARADVYASAFGFRPDNPVAHQTPELQAAIDYCWETGDHVLILDPGTYTVSRTTYFYGLTVEGNGAVLVKPQPTYINHAIFESYEQRDYNRKVPLITKDVGRTLNASGETVMAQDIDRRKYIWKGPGASPTTLFRNLVLVGDAKAMDESAFNQHQREHSHGIVCAGTAGGRLTVRLENIVFKNFTGNGAYFRNAGVWIDKYDGIDCFRGIWSGTANVNVLATNGRSFGKWGGMDIEPQNDVPGKVVIKGFTTHRKLDIALRNDWTADVDGVTVLGGVVNIVTRDRNTFTIRNSSLNPGPGKNINIEIRTLGERSIITFDNVDLNGAPILWIQRNGSMSVLDLRGARNVGPIVQTQVDNPGANILLQ